MSLGLWLWGSLAALAASNTCLLCSLFFLSLEISQERADLLIEVCVEQSSLQAFCLFLLLTYARTGSLVEVPRNA